MKPIPILFLIYDLEPGGPELRLLDLARRFSADWPIHICVTSRKLTLLPEYLACPCNVSVIVVPIRRAYLDFGGLMRIWRYVRRNHIRIINSYDIKGLLIGAAIRALSGKQVVTVHHTVDVLHNFSLVQKWALRVLLQTTSASLCNAHSIRRFIENTYTPARRIHVIHNGIDSAVFRKDLTSRKHYRTTYGIDDTETLIGTVANFREEKHYPFLFQAFIRVRQQYPKVRLMCVGGGPDFHRLKALAESMGLQDVIFTGYVQDVAGHLSAMDLFVFCSLHEGLPNAILQAMSMPLPIVSSAVGGICELITDGREGLLVDADHMEDFLGAVSDLLEHEQKAQWLAGNARQKILESFSLETMVDRYEEFFRQVFAAARFGLKEPLS
jgi:glycosyltransferase involved in cell wall biosynthesis